MTYDHGPLRTYEVIWKSGHVEQVRAHQVILPRDDSFLFEVVPSSSPRPRRLLIHGEVDGYWTLILDADYDEIQSVRLLVNEERPS